MTVTSEAKGSQFVVLFDSISGRQDDESELWPPAVAKCEACTFSTLVMNETSHGDE